MCLHIAAAKTKAGNYTAKLGLWKPWHVDQQQSQQWRCHQTIGWLNYSSATCFDQLHA